jgi:hypothetical protein
LIENGINAVGDIKIAPLAESSVKGAASFWLRLKNTIDIKA